MALLNTQTALVHILIAVMVILITAWLAGSWFGQMSRISRAVCKGGKIVSADLPSLITEQINHLQQKAETLTKENEQIKLSAALAKKQTQNLEAVIYGITDAVVVSDSAGAIIMANASAGELFGFDHQKISREKLEEIITHSDFVKLIKRCTNAKTRYSSSELEFEQPDRIFTYQCKTSCIFDSSGQLEAVVSVLQDKTREKEISQMKNDFVSHVSHELKTPLASITAYSEMLADGEAEDEETRTEFYQIIQNQAKRLNRLIEDILNVSRIESGLIKVSKEIVSVPVLIRQSTDAIRSYAAEKDITVSQNSDIVFGQILADKDMISQVLINLLSNAVKYTPNGGSVEVSCDIDEAKGLARVCVSDTGVGIPAEEIDNVFDKFYRVKANNKCAKGTGLGLNLVKQIVEKIHNGKVFVQSEQGKGSCFGFEIALASAHTAATV